MRHKNDMANRALEGWCSYEKVYCHFGGGLRSAAGSGRSCSEHLKAVGPIFEF
jgi:hypothetical protein